MRRTTPPQPVRCTIAQAHALTGLSYAVLRDHAARGAIPGASKPSGRWLFVIEDLKRWVTRITDQPQQPRPKRPAIVRAQGRISRLNPEQVTAAYDLVLSRPDRISRKS